MNEEKIKEFLFKAQQMGKSETSGLVSAILGKIDESVEKAVNKYVNGKLDDIKNHLKRQDEHMVKIEDEIKTLKTDTEPIVEGRKALGYLGKIAIWVAAVVGAIIALVKFARL